MARRSTSGTTDASSGEAGASSESFPRDRMHLVIVGFLALLFIYLLLFFSQEVVAGVPAYERLMFLLLPDQLLSDWLGGEVGRFALWDRAWPIAVVAAMLAVAFFLGRLLVDWSGTTGFWSRMDAVVLSLGLGLSAVSLFTLGVGLLGGLRQPIWFALLGILAAGGYFWRVRHGGWLPCDNAPCSGTWDPVSAGGNVEGNESGAGEQSGARPWWRSRWWWAAGPFVAILIAGALLPPLDFDVLEYHLQVPKEWYQQQRVTFLPHNIYGNMPLGGEMLAACAMTLMPGELSWWWGALAGKLAMAAFALLTAGLLFAAGRRWFSARAGMVAALLYLSTAWIHVVSQNGLNEGVVGYYLFASFYVGRIWWEARGTNGRPAEGLLVLAGLLAGSAVACKYTSVVLVVLPLLVAVAWRTWPRCIRSCLIFLLAVTAACGLWLGKNGYFTGNPTYPLLYRTLGGATRTVEKDAQWRRAHQVPRDASGRRYGPGQAWRAALNVLGGSAWQNPLIVPFAVLLVLRRGSRSVQLYWIILLSAYLAVWWFATHRLERFWVPVIPVMILLAAGGATWSATPTWRRVSSLVLALGLVLNFVYIVAPRPQIADNRYFVSLDQLREDPRMTLPPDAHGPAAFRYLNEHVPPGARALVVGNAAVFPLRVPVLYNTCFDDCQFECIFRGRTEQQRRERLAELEISHIYIDWAELRRYRQPGNYGYSPYVTRQLVHEEMVERQQLLRPVNVPGLEPELGEVFEVVAAARTPRNKGGSLMSQDRRQ